MRIKNLALIFGIILIAVGILGFFSFFTPDGYLLGLFHVNIAHNVIHLLTGIAALLCSLNTSCTSRVFFQVFGVVYGIIFAFGLYYQDAPIFGLIANNVYDIWLHLLISSVSLYLGFIYQKHEIAKKF